MSTMDTDEQRKQRLKKEGTLHPNPDKVRSDLLERSSFFDAKIYNIRWIGLKIMNDAVKDNDSECAAMIAIKILGRKWIPWIICELIAEGELYFSDLQDRIEGNYGEKKFAF